MEVFSSLSFRFLVITLEILLVNSYSLTFYLKDKIENFLVCSWEDWVSQS